jgi:electron transport complex protein RnfC
MGFALRKSILLWLCNELYEALVGRRFMPDPIDWANEFRGDLTGNQLPNTVNLGINAGLAAASGGKVGRLPTAEDFMVKAEPGKAVANLDATTLKGTSALLFLTEQETRRAPETACIRCGKCADACPMGLEPFLLQKLSRIADTEALEANAAQDCIECGCCLYSCPAHIPLLDIIRTGKGLALGAIRARAAAAKAAAEAAKK